MLLVDGIGGSIQPVTSTLMGMRGTILSPSQAIKSAVIAMIKIFVAEYSFGKVYSHQCLRTIPQS